jgi:hypothetical protein
MMGLEEMIVMIAVLLLLVYSWKQLITSSRRQEAGLMDQFQMLSYARPEKQSSREPRSVGRYHLLLFTLVTLDVLCPIVLLLMPGWNSRITKEGVVVPRLDEVSQKALIILGGTLPLLAGGLIALRKGPARIAMSVACLLLVICWSFFYWVAFFCRPVYWFGCSG